MADERADVGAMEGHVPISRCCSVVALWLGGEPVSKIRNRDRRISRKTGDVYDPFSPWYVLSMQAYPDWKSSVHSHDSTKHYVNGPEAFLITLRAEFKGAQKRLMEVYNRTSDLVRSPPDFMFKQSIRDRLLFEDDGFTYIRRYFWAQKSLGIKWRYQRNNICFLEERGLLDLAFLSCLGFFLLVFQWFLRLSRGMNGPLRTTRSLLNSAIFLCASVIPFLGRSFGKEGTGQQQTPLWILHARILRSDVCLLLCLSSSNK